MRLKVIGCSIFRKEIEHLRGTDFAVTWLPAGLHVSDERLGAALGQALAGEEEVACFYGACHSDMNLLLAGHGGRRLQARNCVEAFLDPVERARLGERVFIMTPGWLREWRSIFIEGLGWDEIDGRINFGGYDKIVCWTLASSPSMSWPSLSSTTTRRHRSRQSRHPWVGFGRESKRSSGKSSICS